MSRTSSGDDGSQRLDGEPAGTALKRLEFLSTLILALGSMLTAWSAFQSSKWSSLQIIAFNDAAVARNESTQAATHAGQQVLIDVVSFAHWVKAFKTEYPVRVDIKMPYTPNPATLSGFLHDRFRAEFKPAVEAWLATRPLFDPHAPPTPFAMPEYQLERQIRAQQLSALAEKKADEALAHSQRSGHYVQTTVILAIALFFAGVSLKLESRMGRILMNAIAIVIIVVAIGLLLSYPVAS